MKVPLAKRRTTVIGGASVLRQNQRVSVQRSARFFMSKRSPFALIFCLALFTSMGAVAATISTTTHSTSSTHKAHSKSSNHISASTKAQKEVSRMRHSSASVDQRKPSNHTSE